MHQNRQDDHATLLVRFTGNNFKTNSTLYYGSIFFKKKDVEYGTGTVIKEVLLIIYT